MSLRSRREFEDKVMDLVGVQVDCCGDADVRAAFAKLRRAPIRRAVFINNLIEDAEAEGVKAAVNTGAIDWDKFLTAMGEFIKNYGPEIAAFIKIIMKMFAGA